MSTSQMEKQYPPVLTKRDFVRRYQNGEFGNRAPTWDSYDEWYYDKKDTNALYHIRNRVAGGTTYYNVRAERLSHMWAKLCQEVKPSSLYISVMAPTEKTVIQGEIQDTDGTLRFTYSTVVAPMRNALAIETRHASDLLAWSLVKKYMDPPSFDWLWVLLDRYPNHVIEFSVYSVCWGTLPNRNTVFWEVRNY